MLDQQEREPMQGLADYLRAIAAQLDVFDTSTANVSTANVSADINALRAWANEVEAARRCAAAPQTRRLHELALLAAADLEGWANKYGDKASKDTATMLRDAVLAAPPRLQGQT